MAGLSKYFQVHKSEECGITEEMYCDILRKSFDLSYILSYNSQE
jgi:hypothetical protein